MSQKKEQLREEFLDEIKNEYILVPKKNHNQGSRPSHLTYTILDTVISVVAKKRGHDFNMLKSKFRGSENGYKVPESRHIYYWMSSRIDDMVTWSTMARHIDKDHATAMHGFRQVENWLTTDKGFRQHVLEICDLYITSFLEIDTKRLQTYISQYK